jgi:hypothetical protein
VKGSEALAGGGGRRRGELVFGGDGMGSHCEGGVGSSGTATTVQVSGPTWTEHAEGSKLQGLPTSWKGIIIMKSDKDRR